MTRKPLSFKIIRAFWILSEICLIPVEKLLWFVNKSPINKTAFNPIFIVGAPRSGTTLLSQVFLQYFNVAYFNNITANFPKTPVAATWFFKRMFDKIPQSEYTSNFGKTSGKYGAHEAAEFWYRWFPRGEGIYTPAGDLSEKQRNELAVTIQYMAATAGKPFAFKNTYNAMRLGAILEAIPNAIILVCHRDPVDNAQSILNARIKNFQSKATWWSVPPKEIDQIRNLNYNQQVVDQVYYIEEQIKRDENDRFVHVNYQELCQEPQKTLDTIAEKIETKGLNLSIRNPNLPESFQLSTGCKVDPDDYEQIQAHVNELWGEK